MTEHKTTPVNAIAHRTYLDEMQSSATRLAGIIKAAAYLENDGGCDDGRAALVYLAERFANELANDLDFVNRPKGEVA